MRRRDLISFALLGAALLVAVLAIGGALRTVQAVVAILAAGSLALHFRSRRRFSRISPLLILVGAAIALTALQLVPLPAALRHWLNPEGETLRAMGAELSGTSPWPSLSLDPAGTLRGLAYFITLGGVALAALRFSATEKGRFALLAAVAVTAGLAALVSGVHALLNLETLYGIYTPLQASTSRMFGPLLNTNHLGSLMSLGSLVSIGLAFYPRQNTWLRVLWIVNAIACLLLLLVTLSRGAVLAFAFGVAVTGVMLFAKPSDAPPNRQRSRDSNMLVQQLPIAIVVAFGLALTIYFGAGKVASQLDNTSLSELDQASSKYAAWKSSLQLVDDSPWLGIGRGALEPALTRVHEPVAQLTYMHLENEYLQALVEWGMIGAVVLLFALVFCIARALRRWRDGPLAAAALGGVAGVLLQSTVDFGVQLMGVAVPLTIVAATLLPAQLREMSAPTLRVRLARVLALAALAGAAILFLQPATRSLQEDHHDMVTERWDLAKVHEVIERHPLDYYAYSYVARLQLRDRDPRVARYLNHALRLNPTNPETHRLVALLMLVLDRRNQAAIEYRLALQRSPTPSKLVTEILTRLPSTEEAARAMPLELRGVDVIYRLLIENKRQDVALRWLSQVIKQPQRDVAVIDRLYKLAMEQRAYELAETAARARGRIERTNTSRLMLAKSFAAGGNKDRLLLELADVATWKGRIDEKTEAWLLVCDVRIERREWDPAVQCLHMLDGSGALLAEKRSEVTRRLNTIKEQRSLEARQQALESLQRDIEQQRLQKR